MNPFDAEIFDSAIFDTGIEIDTTTVASRIRVVRPLRGYQKIPRRR